MKTINNRSSVLIWLTLAMVSPASCVLAQAKDAPTWTFEVSGRIYSDIAMSVDGTVYAVSMSSNSAVLYAVNGATGSKLWETPIDREVWRSSPAVGANGTIFLGTEDGDLRAFTPSGAPLWAVRTGSGRPVSAPAIALDGSIYFKTSLGSAEQLFSISFEGETNWMTTMGAFDPAIGGYKRSAPAVRPDGRIYIGSSSNLYCLASSGEIKWVSGLGSHILASPAIDCDGTVYVGALDGALYAFDGNGRQKWKYQATSGRGSIESSVAISEDGTIRFGVNGGPGVWALSASGEWLWSSTAVNTTIASPALDATGGVYVPGFTGRISYWDSCGSSIWYGDAPPTFDSVGSSSPLISPDGTVIVGMGDKLYAFARGVPPMRSAWPTHRHDAQRTGRAVQTRIHVSAILPNGEIELVLGVESGRAYTVQSSTDLNAWSDELTLTPEVWNPKLVRPANPAPRFFRLRTQE